MERARYIRVPKNREAMEHYDFGIQTEEEMEELILSQKQYEELDNTGVFNIINEKCNIIIDEYEEEILEFDKIPMALEVVTQLLNHNKNDNLVRLKKIVGISYFIQNNCWL